MMPGGLGSPETCGAGRQGDPSSQETLVQHPFIAGNLRQSTHTWTLSLRRGGLRAKVPLLLSSQLFACVHTCMHLSQKLHMTEG